MKLLFFSLIIIFLSSFSTAAIKELPAEFTWKNDGILVTGAEAQELFEWLPVNSSDSSYCVEYDYSDVIDHEDEPSCKVYHDEPQREKKIRYKYYFQEGIQCNYNPEKAYYCHIYSESWDKSDSKVKAIFREETSDVIGKEIKTAVFQSSGNTKLFCNELLPNRTYDCFIEYDK